jgi:hypothetical protein
VNVFRMERRLRNGMNHVAWVRIVSFDGMAEATVGFVRTFEGWTL